jgi:hypothetical protein
MGGMPKGAYGVPEQVSARRPSRDVHHQVVLEGKVDERNSVGANRGQGVGTAGDVGEDTGRKTTARHFFEIVEHPGVRLR